MVYNFLEVAFCQGGIIFEEEKETEMLNLEVKTKLSIDDVAKRAKRFFGKGGLGLEVSEENQQCLSFDGGGGYVTATLCPEGDMTRVTLVTQEWDHQVKEFASSLP